MQTIVYLHSEIMPYEVVVLKELSVAKYNVHVVYNDEKRLTPYSPPEIPNVYFYSKSKFTKKTLLEFVLKLSPLIVVVAGWADSDYLYISKKVRSRLKIPVVCGIDTQFLRRIKQFLGILASNFYIKPCFSHLWVPGIRQYEFARLLGYRKDKIILNLLAGDIALFLTADLNIKTQLYPKNFLFVGRYAKVKGIDLLLDAWNSIENKKGWTLTFVGNGPLKPQLLNQKGVIVHDFKSQAELVELAQQSGCFVLPSLYEPWALVIQEFAATGLPIVCSDACGASTKFVEHGYNGLVFKTGDKQSLVSNLIRIINAPDEQLLLMSERSRYLSKRITPEISAYSLLSIIDF